MSQQHPSNFSDAVLALADGTLFYGKSIGISGQTVGEVVFNTAMTGYQEMLTDPSYTRQILTLTYPHIGNVGTNEEDKESDRVYAAGLIIRDSSLIASNWRNQKSLQDYLHEQKLVAIADIDTRRLTRLLREKGAQNGCIIAGEKVDADEAIKAAKEFSGLKGLDLAKIVTTKKAYIWRRGTWKLDKNSSDEKTDQELPYHVVAYDFGVKQNILRILVDHGCCVTVVPATTPAKEALVLQPDGIFLSNGPGDPEPCDYAIMAIREFLKIGIPIYGICLGHQLLALAAGAKTIKTKFGHHGANHPVQELKTGRVLITSQNHGFAVDASTLPSNVIETYHSLFDGTSQGIELTDKPAYSFQGHPEASPGPHDMKFLFEKFIEMMKKKE
jgi:carbamoyl-phosphate synthase small subunit